MYTNELTIQNETVYEVNPNIQVISAETIQEFESSLKVTVKGFIDMDTKFFDISGAYKFFMNEKSFEMTMVVPRFDSMVFNRIKSSSTLLDLIRINSIHITL